MVAREGWKGAQQLPRSIALAGVEVMAQNTAEDARPSPWENPEPFNREVYVTLFVTLHL